MLAKKNALSTNLTTTLHLIWCQILMHSCLESLNWERYQLWSLCISACCSSTNFSNQASCEKDPLDLRSLNQSFMLCLSTSAPANYYLRFILVTRDFIFQACVNHMEHYCVSAVTTLPNSHFYFKNASYIYKKFIFAAHDWIQHSDTHIYNTDIKTKVSL